jgi:tetratricopeptide (TPR) repeat protein
MNGNEMTRRQVLAVGAGAIIAGRVGIAQTPKRQPDGTWIGRTVLPKRYALTVMAIPGSVPADGKWGEAPWDLLSASQAVKSEKGTRVEVLDEDKACWIERDHLVLLEDAVDFFAKVLSANDTDRFALVSRGWAYYLLGKPDKAVADFDAFLKLAPAGGTGVPARWEGLANRGLVLAEQGEFEKALKDLNEAVNEPQGTAIMHLNRGYAFELMGEYEKALDDYRTARKLLAENNGAWILATCPDAKFRNGRVAVEIALDVCKSVLDREGMFLDTLAAACAEAGKFDEAVKSQENALADKSFALRYGDEARKRLRLYQDKKPYRSEPVKTK